MNPIIITPAPKQGRGAGEGTEGQEGTNTRLLIPEKYGSILGETFKDTHLVMTSSPMRIQTHVIYHNFSLFK